MTPPVEHSLTSRGLRETDPQVLNDALAAVLDGMERLAYGDAPGGLPAAEQTVLREGGLDLEPQPGPDPLAMTAVKYAAIVERSLTSREAGEYLDLAGGRVRQLIADRSLYSFLMGNRRLIPRFQFLPDGGLVPNIAVVNRALSARLHPVEVFNWLLARNADLFRDEDLDATVSPLDWLKAGYDASRVALLARRL
ncbi:MAG: hypothetical protein OXP70_05225 [Acidobacteriota bacterium]|nr:hypothetical protein [Acidobacteriota bacterium]